MLHASATLCRAGSRKMCASTPIRTLTFSSSACNSHVVTRVARTNRKLQVSCTPGLLIKTILPTVQKAEPQQEQNVAAAIAAAAPPATAGVVAAAKTASIFQQAPRALIVSASAAMATTFLYCNGLGMDSALSATEMMHAIAFNIPISASCATLGDIAAQMLIKYQAKKEISIKTIEFGRALAAGSIAGMLQGVGTTVWVNYLNILMPGSSVGFDSLSKFGVLGLKVVLDSWAWGTVLNTLNITMRRAAAGDSYEEAKRKWSKSIVGVTAFEFKFWPVWGSMVYTALPVEGQVAGFAVGGFLWSIYLSLVASGSQKNKAIHRRMAWYGRPVGCRVNQSSSFSAGHAAALHKAAGGMVLANAMTSRSKVQKNKYVLAKNDETSRNRKPTYRLLRQDIKGGPRSGQPRKNVSRSMLTL